MSTHVNLSACLRYQHVGVNFCTLYGHLHIIWKPTNVKFDLKLNKMIWSSSSYRGSNFVEKFGRSKLWTLLKTASFENSQTPCKKTNPNFPFNGSKSGLVALQGRVILVKNVEEESYPMPDLISDIGGTIGLFLGLSVVQVAFMCKALFLRLVRHLRRGIGTVSRTVSQICSKVFLYRPCSDMSRSDAVFYRNNNHNERYWFWVIIYDIIARLVKQNNFLFVKEYWKPAPAIDWYD